MSDKQKEAPKKRLSMFARKWAAVKNAKKSQEEPPQEPVEELKLPQETTPASSPEALHIARAVPKFLLDSRSENATDGLYDLHREQVKQALGETPNCRPNLALDNTSAGKEFPLTESQLEQEIKRSQSNLEICATMRLGKAKEEQPEGTPPPALPAEYFVHMAQGCMMAWMLIFPPVFGGKDPNLEDAKDALRKMSINTGIDYDEINRVIEQKQFFRLFPVAWGTPVREGKDGYLIEHFEREHVREPEMNEHGDMDYREQSYVRTITKGTAICNIVPPTPGENGIQVNGKAVKVKRVNSARVPGGRNTMISEDGTQLVASLDGHLEFSGDAFMVKSALEIAGDVDYSTGNINFLGDVHIAGDVRENFVVKATGSIVIDGLVEAASVEADGDVIITKGVIGDNRAVIRSRRKVRAKYLENCVIHAGDCVVADCIVTSKIYSDHSVEVKSGRGTIIGGFVSAAICVEADVVGSKSGRRTEIVLGRMPNVEEERNVSEKELKLVSKELHEVELQISYVERKSDTPENAKLRGKLRLRKSVLSLKQEKLTKRLAELAEMTPDISQCRLKCGTVYQNTSITIGSAMRSIENTWVNCTARYDAANDEVSIV